MGGSAIGGSTVHTYLVLATNGRNGLSLLESLLTAPGDEFWDVEGVLAPPITPPTIGGPSGELMVIGFSPSELNLRNPPERLGNTNIV